MMKIIGMIPARMNSSRFRGKAIYPILSKPMIYWVYKQAKKVEELDEIYVVTSDIEIKECCIKYDIPCICNKTNETTAAQKIAIESQSLDADIIINIQGDEPLVNPSAIKQIISAMVKDKSLNYVGLKSHIKTEKEFNDPNIVKVVTDDDDFALYFSRSPIPYKYDQNYAFRVMGLYGYRKEFLNNFLTSEKGKLENLELGVEMLRVMALGYKIKLLDTKYNSIGVDLQEHIKIVEDIMINSKEYGEYTDLYDENKKLTDKKLFREKGFKLTVPKGYYNIVVLAFIKNSKDEFLLQKISKNKGSMWAVTGGHVKSGETSLECVINEIKEELGIFINENDIHLFKTYKYETAFKDVYYIEKDIDVKNLNYEKDEVEYAEYFTVDEINQLIENGEFRKTNIDAFLDIVNKD